ncbi:hypothetical protein ABL840_03655 [Variovorax sp. NFACC27]|jgi:hypothetical protein|uniref:hypothetical protein n=1 Tax=unclassified Variovorax TaxID=663243 RepID=UPI000896CF9B|nr:hypothetical protein [Variovorax sp. YR750]SEF26078.1 hypothetical protein SAMN03159371_02392 [Variovorax sp. NFACC28]SEG52176.1 hypothetical protein SAMN03159365_02473 [Variovorax sp. NFACC29]SFC18009.1 hypothetical protein SAMN03159379_01637 [Variovorax sp. NFACC26]SFH00419.1 hypothetical protein SAMN03159447_06047 [Variovorax sp. NFACC27]SEL79625.1 hypothetical protein SAMN05518845_111147 [Variovorax sp. YR750]
MKILFRLICIVLGGLALSFVVTKGLLVPIGQWYEMNKAQSESDLTQAFVIALAMQALSAIVGGWLGDWLLRKWLRKRLDRQ